MTLTDTFETELKAQAAAIADEAIAGAGVALDEFQRRSLVHGLETQAVTSAEFMKGSPAEVLAECARVGRLLMAEDLARLRSGS